MMTFAFADLSLKSGELGIEPCVVSLCGIPNFVLPFPWNWPKAPRE